MAENGTYYVIVAQFHSEIKYPFSATLTLKSMHMINLVSFCFRNIIVVFWYIIYRPFFFLNYLSRLYVYQYNLSLQLDNSSVEALALSFR